MGTEHVYRNGYMVKRHRKLAWHEHKGVAYYDRERMRRPLAPHAHLRDFQGWFTPLPSWIDANWNAPDESVNPMPADDSDALAIVETAEFRLERCHLETVCERHERQRGEWIKVRRPVTYRWQLTFADGAVFRFVSRAIAEAALPQLLKIRKAKHPRPRYAKPSPETDCLFFTERKLAALPADTPDKAPADAVLSETAA